MARKPDPDERYARRLRAHNPRRRTTDERIALSMRGGGGMPAAPSTPNGGGTPYGAMAMLAMQQQMAASNGQPTSDGGAPYPNMPKVSMTTPPKGMMGATGTAILSGVIQNDSKGEYNPDWYWRDFIPIIDQMRRSDGQIQAIEQTIRQPIERATWSIQAATDDGVDQIIASFVESALLEGMVDTSRDGDPVRTTWRETLQQILNFLWYGFMVFEQVYTDPRQDPDGYVKFARWVPLLPRTVWRWWTNGDNDLVGIQQWTYRDFAFKFVNIRAGKLLRFHHRMEGSNYDGWPLFRAAYPHWFAKTNLLNIAAVGAERNSIAPPWFRLPHVSATDTDYQTALKIAQNIRANEQLAVVTPDDWMLEYLKAGNGELEHVIRLVEYHDQLIARSVLAQFLTLGGSRGAYNLDASQKLTFLAALQSVAEYICDVINTDAIKRLVDYNFAGVTVYPKLVCSKLVAQDITLLSQALQQMAQYFPPSPELNDFLARELGLPATPQSFVQTTNPGENGQPGSPDGQQGQQGSDQGQQGQQQDSGQEGEYDSTSGAPYENGPSEGYGEGYGEELDGLREEARLLREALDAAYGVDAVERAEAHEAQSVRLFNPNHGRDGRFATGGGGGQHESGGAGEGGAKLVRHAEERDTYRYGGEFVGVRRNGRLKFRNQETVHAVRYTHPETGARTYVVRHADRSYDVSHYATREAVREDRPTSHERGLRPSAARARMRELGIANEHPNMARDLRSEDRTAHPSGLTRIRRRIQAPAENIERAVSEFERMWRMDDGDGDGDESVRLGGHEPGYEQQRQAHGRWGVTTGPYVPHGREPGGNAGASGKTGGRKSEEAGGGAKKSGGTRSTRAPRKPKEPTAADRAQADDRQRQEEREGDQAGGRGGEEAAG